MYFLCLYGPACVSTQNLLPSMTVARGARLTREEAWSSRGRFSNDATLGLVRWGKAARTHFSSGVERINTQTLAPPFAEVIDREQNRCDQRKKTLV